MRGDDAADELRILVQKRLVCDAVESSWCEAFIGMLVVLRDRKSVV